MPDKIPAEDPKLELAARRLSANLRVWALLFGGMGMIALGTLQSTHPGVSLIWLTTAILLAIGNQPAFLGLVAVQWGLSLSSFLPGVSQAIGPDPLSVLLNSRPLETIGLVVIRIVLMITAVNQLLFYRMLYGTAEATGLDESLPVIPEVVPNRSDQVAWYSRLLGLLGFPVALAAVLPELGISEYLLGVSTTLATIAMGFGIGAAFSPTRRRGLALTGLAAGAAVYLISIIIARYTIFV